MVEKVFGDRSCHNPRQANIPVEHGNKDQLKILEKLQVLGKLCFILIASIMKGFLAMI